MLNNLKKKAFIFRARQRDYQPQPGKLGSKKHPAVSYETYRAAMLIRQVDRAIKFENKGGMIVDPSPEVKLLMKMRREGKL